MPTRQQAEANTAAGYLFLLRANTTGFEITPHLDMRL